MTLVTDGLGYADDGEEHFSGESGDDGEDLDEANDDVDYDGADVQRQKKKRTAATSNFQPLGAMLSRTSTGGTGDAARGSHKSTAAAG